MVVALSNAVKVEYVPLKSDSGDEQARGNP
jgi:hypothetical protein